MEVVITSIFPPTEGTLAISEGLQAGGGGLWVIGDRKGPFAYDLPGVRFFSIDAQAGLPFHLARLLSERSYARKNLGYLLAIQAGATAVVETDDDNIPLPEFWSERDPVAVDRVVAKAGWCNVYRAFSLERVWPRGFPLEFLEASWGDDAAGAAQESREALIVQGLANENPDVDAVYRMTGRLPLDFDAADSVFLERGAWCPFNSQNTTTFPDAYPLLYLPTHCSFRMTDIWRSFVAQRCLWEMDSGVRFTQATVYQRRNEHSLLRDFEDEVSGYLANERIRQALEALTLERGRDFATVGRNVTRCYEALVALGVIRADELASVAAWLEDLASLGR